MDIKDLIPQREPFLFIDKVEDITEDTIITTMTFSSELDFFKGHFPNNPIVPGVILNEHCFQSGAALISHNSQGDFNNSLAVVSRINSAKFKQIIRPNEKIHTKTIITDHLDNAAYFKSVVTNEDKKKALIIEFACTLVRDHD